MTSDSPAVETIARPAPKGARALGAFLRPFRSTLRGLDRFVMRMDHAPAGQTIGAIRLRRAVALLIGGYALVFLAQGVLHGKFISHFLAPVLLAFLLWAVWRGQGFSDLLFGILVVSIMGDITFLLAPTAPPWLASNQGLIPPVQPILKDTLEHLQLTGLAAHKG